MSFLLFFILTLDFPQITSFLYKQFAVGLLYLTIAYKNHLHIKKKKKKKKEEEEEMKIITIRFEACSYKSENIFEKKKMK